MYRCKIFREPSHFEDTLAASVEECLNENNIKRENIVNIKTFSENGFIYCMIIWEE